MAVPLYQNLSDVARFPPEEGLLRVALTCPRGFDHAIGTAQAADAKLAREAADARKRGALLSGYYSIPDPVLRRAFLRKYRVQLFAANR